MGYVVGVGELQAEIILLDDIHGVKHPLVQLVTQRLFRYIEGEVSLVQEHDLARQNMLGLNMQAGPRPPILHSLVFLGISPHSLAEEAQHD